MISAPSIVGVGVDVVDVGVVRAARFKERLAEYFLTDEELHSVPNKAKISQFLASRFALKEAVIKAFPLKISPFEFVITKQANRPVVHFVAPEHNTRYQVFASITHTDDVAAAIAVIVDKVG